MARDTDLEEAPYPVLSMRSALGMTTGAYSASLLFGHETRQDGHVKIRFYKNALAIRGWSAQFFFPKLAVKHRVNEEW